MPGRDPTPSRSILLFVMSGKIESSARAPKKSETGRPWMSGAPSRHCSASGRQHDGDPTQAAIREGAEPMTGWSAEDLATVGNAEEFEIASRRPDGSLRPYVTIWGVANGDEIFVRSAHGYDNPWFQRALRSGEGRIRAGGLERDVAFEVARARGGRWHQRRVSRQVRPLRADHRWDRCLARVRSLDPEARAALNRSARHSEHRNRARRPCTVGFAMVGDTGFEPVTSRM
jgi:hypothetical protein